MIGLIVTGHGHFASGLTSSLKLISGNNLDHYEYVDFTADDSVEVLEENLNKAFESLNDCDGILVLADLVGGSPFKSSTIIGVPKGNVEIIAGTNLPMLVEINLLRTFQNDVKALANQAVETGKSMISKYVFTAYVEEESDEGI